MERRSADLPDIHWSLTTGNAEVEFAGGDKGDALIVAVRCQGAGTVSRWAGKPGRSQLRLM
ncbi:hypothetical protein [Streptomyces sp. DT195]|uniref:hypothetical protein n=1 Tax=Streptomyces sp. DT195 TaxID=3393419 RepID=UPI003CFAEEAF